MRLNTCLQNYALAQPAHEDATWIGKHFPKQRELHRRPKELHRGGKNVLKFFHQCYFPPLGPYSKHVRGPHKQVETHIDVKENRQMNIISRV